MSANRILAVAWVLLAGGEAYAQQKPHRPAFEASDATRARYEAIHAAAKPVLRRGDPVVESPSRRSATGELVDIVDGVITIRVPLTAEQADALVERGVRRVTREGDARPGVVFDRFFYAAYAAQPEVDLAHLDGRRGRTVRLELVALESGRLRVVSASLSRE